MLVFIGFAVSQGERFHDMHVRTDPESLSALTTKQMKQYIRKTAGSRRLVGCVTLVALRLIKCRTDMLNYTLTKIHATNSR